MFSNMKKNKYQLITILIAGSIILLVLFFKFIIIAKSGYTGVTIFTLVIMLSVLIEELIHRKITPDQKKREKQFENFSIYYWFGLSIFIFIGMGLLFVFLLQILSGKV